MNTVRTQITLPNRRKIAQKIFRTGSLANHPEWKNKADINAWVRSLREEKEDR